ncbi:BTAD domain-containing putative transcriptional regulator [Kutzneria sp. NPDC052558]|uniref:AfsR/SARP family transcriptional regulator n=1 Tax=Kutzneria sp. NPDC052558 TaxID=3364121 RepID=UPI0037CBD161
MEFHLLGPLRVVRDGSEIPLNAAKQRALLAVLALHAGQLLAADELIDRLWGSTPPAGARNTLRTYVMRLRKALGDPSVIETMLDGYRLVGGTTDIQRFDSLLAANPDLSQLDQALALWRGDPADGLLPTEAQTLAERRLDALTRRCELAVTLHRHDEAIPVLRDLVARHPLREKLWALLIRALHATGRQPEAVAAYDQARNALADELGIDPGAELQSAHASVAGTAPRRAVSQLPPSIGNFVGRRHELDALRQQLKSTGIAVVSGPPGIGKTALAVRSAHELKADFPDGQLFVNLRGYARIPRMTSAEVLSRFLRALGVPPDQIPLDTELQVHRYRSELAGKCILVLLDNVGDADQIRPLLPKEPGCGVIATSRTAFHDLPTQPLQLDVLDADDSMAMLGATLGTDALNEEKDAAVELARLCGHLPLALRIAAGNLIDTPANRIERYVAEIRNRNRLDALRIDDDENTAVRTAFDISYHALPSHPQRLFRLLSLTAGTDFTTPIAATLLNVTEEEATRLLAILTTANLIQQHTTGRHQLHDLVRDYARERVLKEESATTIQHAIHRMLDHYLHSIHNATDASDKAMRSLDPPSAEALVQPARFATADQAERWLEAELNNVLSAIEISSEQPSPWHAWHLTDAIDSYLRRTCSGTLRLSTALRTLTAATRAGDIKGQAAIHRIIGSTYIANIDSLNADISQKTVMKHVNQAVSLSRQAGNSAGEAFSLLTKGTGRAAYGHPQSAIQDFQQALAVFDGKEPEKLRTTVTANIGTALYEVGHLKEAERYQTEALAASKRLKLRVMVIRATYNLGRIHTAMGRFDLSITDHQKSFKLAEQLGMENIATTSLAEIARNHACRGDVAAAHDQFRVIQQWWASHDERQAHQPSMTALAAAHLALGHLEQALTTYQAIAASSGHTWNVHYLNQALCGIAEIHASSGRFDEATAFAHKAIKTARASQSRIYEGVATSALASAEWALGDRESATAHSLEALGIHRTTGHRPGEAHTLRLLGTIIQANDTNIAVDHWRQALKLYEQMRMPQAVELRKLLAGIRPRGR